MKDNWARFQKSVGGLLFLLMIPAWYCGYVHLFILIGGFVWIIFAGYELWNALKAKASVKSASFIADKLGAGVANVLSVFAYLAITIGYVFYVCREFCN